MAESKTKLRREPLQSLIEYIRHSDSGARKALENKCGTNIDNLRQIGYGYGACSVALAKKIVKGCRDPQIDLNISLGDLVPELKGVLGE